MQSGDRLITAFGDTPTVRWLRRQEIVPDVLHPVRVQPIRVRAGALGAGVPACDLCVSPDHTHFVCGALI